MQTLRHQPVCLSDGERVTHSVTSTGDGRIIGHLSRMRNTKDLRRDGTGARYSAVVVNYTVSPNRLSMVFDENSVAYVDTSKDVSEFVNPAKIDEDSKRVLIPPSGLPEAVLIFANEPTSPHIIQVINNAPLAEALRAKAASMPGLRDSVTVIVGASPFAGRI